MRQCQQDESPPYLVIKGDRYQPSLECIYLIAKNSVNTQSFVKYYTSN
jgi:hypothetical protein